MARPVRETLTKQQLDCIKELVQKENPTKELIIATIAKALESLDIKDLTIENKAKLITFSLNNEDFKVDLVQKRKKKEEK